MWKVIEKHLLAPHSTKKFRKKSKAVAYAKKRRSGFSFAAGFRGVRVVKSKK
jgi:hypothetical protein